MLSILIPVYNINVLPLVTELKNQCMQSAIDFEILAYDDASSKYITENSKIEKLNNCIFKRFTANMGRSKIRNQLGKDAQFSNMLFIDAGTFPKNKSYIKTYLNKTNEKVIVGNMVETEETPKKPYKLRWLYTKYRTCKALNSSNFLIKKDIFLKTKFNESLINYGYEDVAFFYALKQKKIPILQINNPVIHINDDPADRFVYKTELGLNNLKTLIKNKDLNTKESKIYKLYNAICQLKLCGIVAYIFKITRPYMLKNFNSNTPRLFIFDLYRIGYLCSTKLIK